MFSLSLSIIKNNMIVYSKHRETFFAAVQRVQDMLQHDEDYCDLQFGEIIRVRVSKNSNADDLWTIYRLNHTINMLKLGLDV
jgi:hypothetical protein